MEKNTFFRFRKDKLHSNGLMLAEVIIALVILGVIAAITVPSLMRKTSELSNRTKIRKALTMYEKVVENMKITQGLKSVGESGSTDTTTLVGWANSDGNCINGRTYFKIIKSKDRDNCIFQTADKLWWDITDMSEPVISLYKDNDSVDCRTRVSTNKSDACYNKSFYLETEKELSDSKGNAFIVNDVSGYSCYAMKFAKIVGEDVTCPKIPVSKLCKGKTNGELCNVDGIDYRVMIPTKEQVDKANEFCQASIAKDYCIELTEKPYYIQNVPITITQEEAKDLTGALRCIDGSCITYGNYWNAAKRKCSENGHLASVAELYAAYSLGSYKGSYIWLAEDSNISNSSAAYYMSIWGGRIDTCPMVYSWKAVCVGE